MPLSKIQLNPGINKEVTRNTNEQGWYDCDKVRFRQGFPEKIGGWRRIGTNTFAGVCRSLHQWLSNAFVKYTGVGTSSKFYVENEQEYFDVTPLRLTATLGNNPIATENAKKSVTVSHTAHGATLGSYVTLSGVANAINNVPITDLNKEHVITEIVNDDSYKIEVATTANGTGTGGVTNNAVVAAYQVNVGPDSQIAVGGWGSLNWNDGSWNSANYGAEDLRVWNQANYGEDLIIGPRGGKLYYWDTSEGTGTATNPKRAIEVANKLNGAAVTLSFQAVINVAVNFKLAELDVWPDARIIPGLSVDGHAAIPANTTIDYIYTEVGFYLTNAATDTANGITVNFNNNPLSATLNSRALTITDPFRTRVVEVGQHVTISGATAFAGLLTSDINARHKVATVDTATNTFTTEDLPRAAGATAMGGGPTVNLQYELSAEVPIVQNSILASDSSRFVFCFGCNAFGDTVQNPLLMRWSDQEDMFDWRPRSTNQAGDLELSQGTEIVQAIQSRQEILVFTDAALYALQYVGAPVVWGSQLVGSNISIASSKAAVFVNGAAYWMGKGKFYKYDGSVQPLRCDVRKYVFDDLDSGQYEQVFAGSLEEYHEVWWFYCDSQRVAPNKYVVYNYVEDIWYIGTLDRSAWYDSPINDFPIAATSSYNLVEHENGNDDGQNAENAAIDAYITSGQFSIEAGNSFTFVDKLIPDVSFTGSDVNTPSVDFTVLASSAPGAADNNPLSEGGNSAGEVVTTNTVDQYTDKLYIRARGRQMSIKISSDGEGVKWQLGSPSMNMRPDGRRGR